MSMLLNGAQGAARGAFIGAALTLLVPGAGLGAATIILRALKDGANEAAKSSSSNTESKHDVNSLGVG